jgi:hypothetical protein
MLRQNQKLIAHSGFIKDSRAESVQAAGEPMTFGYWFWHGGFVAVISYILIACGTAIFIKYIFSLLKKT